MFELSCSSREHISILSYKLSVFSLGRYVVQFLFLFFRSVYVLSLVVFRSWCLIWLCILVLFFWVD